MTSGDKTGSLKEVKRYEPLTIPIHWVLFIVLGGLSITGLITIFTRDLRGFDRFTTILGGIEFAQMLHRVFAVTLIMVCAFFVIAVIVGIVKNGFNSKLIFTPRDFVDIFRSIRAVLTGGRTDPSGAYHWGMKVFFWIIVVGTAVLGVTGLDMAGTLDLLPFSYGFNLLLHDVFFWLVFMGCIFHVFAVLLVGNEPDFQSMITGYMNADYARRHYPNWDFEGSQESVKASFGQQLRQETANIAHGIEQPVANWLQRRGIVRKILNWGRAYSPWPIQFGIGCCMAEGAAVFSNRWDTERFGILPLFGPRQTDVLMISGAVNKKMLPRLLRIYEQMPDPKFVICFGACAMSGGAFWDNYSLVHPMSDYIPVDVFVPGCPPKPEDLLRGFIMLEEKIRAGDTHWHHMHEPST